MTYGSTTGLAGEPAEAKNLARPMVALYDCHHTVVGVPGQIHRAESLIADNPLNLIRIVPA